MKRCYCKLISDEHHIESIMENIDSENNSSDRVNNKLTLNNIDPVKSKIVKKNLKGAAKKEKMMKMAKSDVILKKLIKSCKNKPPKDGEPPKCVIKQNTSKKDGNYGKPSECVFKQKTSKNDDNIITHETHKTLNCAKHKEKCYTIHIHI